MKKAIWLITGGPMQYIVAKKILDEGFALIVSDRNPQATCASSADLFLAIDTFDVNAHLEACSEVCKKFDVQAVMTFAADCHYTVARVAAHLGVHGLDPEISKICRDKTATRKLLKSAGIYQPDSYMVQTYEAALKILHQYPEKAFVLKASDSSGSRGFQVLTPGKELSEAQFEHTRSYSSFEAVIIEERLFVDSTQISEASVETIWFNGRMYWLNWVDRVFACDLKFFPQIKLPFALMDGIEVGHINPARHDFKVKQTVEDLIESAGHALGMDRQQGGHILKADIFFSTQGPVILELTPRSSGGWDSSGSSPARGADIAGGILHMALGKAIDLDVWQQYFRYRDVERTAVVLSKIPEGAVDCIGRQFTLTSGYGEVSELIKTALKQLEMGKYVSIQ